MESTLEQASSRDQVPPGGRQHECHLVGDTMNTAVDGVQMISEDKYCTAEEMDGT